MTSKISKSFIIEFYSNHTLTHRKSTNKLTKPGNKPHSEYQLISRHKSGKSIFAPPISNYTVVSLSLPLHSSPSTIEYLHFLLFFRSSIYDFRILVIRFLGKNNKIEQSQKAK
jgi:hypothetical protein